MHHQILQRKQIRLLEQILLRGLMILVVATVLKTGAAIISGSTGLYADALVSGLITAGGVMSLSRLQRTGATHLIAADRVDLSYSRILSVVVTLGAIALVFSASWRFHDPQQLLNPLPSLLLGVFAIMFYLSLAIYLLRKSQFYRLRLLGYGARVLGYGALSSTICLLVVAATFWTSRAWLDSLIGLAQGALLVYVAFQLWHQTSATTTRTPLPLAEQAQMMELLDCFAVTERVSFSAANGVLINERRNLSIIMAVPDDWTVVKAQRCADALEIELRELFADAEVEIHLESQEDAADRHSPTSRSTREDFRG